MRIIYIHQYYRTPRMSGGTRSYELARRLVAHGHTVDMITSVPAAEMPSAPEGTGGWVVTRNEGVTVHWCAVEYANTFGVGARLRSFARFLLRASLRAARQPADVVFATSTPLTVAIPAVITSVLRRIPMVFEVRDVWPEVPIAMGYLRHPLARRAALALETLAYRRSTEVVALSPDMARSIAHRHPDTAVSVIPNASDVALFAVDDEIRVRARAARPYLGERPLLVYTGTFGPANDVSYVVEMAAEMAGLAPEVRFLLVGEGKEAEQVRARAQELGVLGTTLFLEPATAKEDVPALLAAADMALSVFAPIPALAANSPNKVFDAFAAGRPVMINNGGWLAEVLEESGAGVVAPPGDPCAAARLVAERLADPAWMAAAGSAAAGLAAGRFDRDRLAEELERVLLRAVAGHDAADRALVEERAERVLDIRNRVAGEAVDRL